MKAFTRAECPGPLPSVAVTLNQLLRERHERGHVLTVSGDVTWCRRCGCASAGKHQRVVGLRERCRGEEAGLRRLGGLGPLRRGRHPLTNRVLGHEELPPAAAVPTVEGARHASGQLGRGLKREREGLPERQDGPDHGQSTACASDSGSCIEGQRQREEAREGPRPHGLWRRYLVSEMRMLRLRWQASTCHWPSRTLSRRRGRLAACRRSWSSSTWTAPSDEPCAWTRRATTRYCS